MVGGHSRRLEHGRAGFAFELDSIGLKQMSLSELEIVSFGCWCTIQGLEVQWTAS